MNQNTSFLAQSVVIVPASTKNPANNDIVVPDVVQVSGTDNSILVAAIASESYINQTLIDGCASAVATYMVGQGYTGSTYTSLASSGFIG